MLLKLSCLLQIKENKAAFFSYFCMGKILWLFLCTNDFDQSIFGIRLDKILFLKVTVFQE